MRWLSLQRLQVIGEVAVAVCCLGLGALSVVVAYGEYHRLSTGAEQLDRFHHVLRAVNAISAERGPANVAMTATVDGRTATTDALTRARLDTDRRLDEVARESQALVDGDQSLFDDVRAELDRGRRSVDSVVTAAPERRTPDKMEAAILAMFSAAGAAEKARDRLGRIIVERTPDIRAEVFLSLSASGLREHAGRLGSYVVMALRSGRADRPEHLARVHDTIGRLTTLRSTVVNFAAPMYASGSIETATRDTESRYFETGVPAALEVMRNAGRPDAIGVADFTAAYVPTMKPVEELRELVMAASHDKIELLRNAAFYRMMLSIALVTLVFLVLLVIAVSFRAYLFRPLVSARRQVIAIASDDLSEPPGRIRAGPEVDEMLDGLNTLRAQQRVRRRLEEDQRRMASRLKTLSETDALTGLLNRRAMSDIAQTLLASSEQGQRRHAALLFDIDHFKSVNDTYGHAIGDAVLKTFAQAMLPLLRPTDIFARIGGEEFVVVLRDTPIHEAGIVAERLRERIARTEIAEEKTLRVTCSCGVALWEPRRAMTLDDLLAVADRRLYAAKRAGRNRICDRDPELAQGAA